MIVGDAVCAFNPIYGQGMTVAALGAMALDRALRKRRARPDGAFALRFQRELAKTNTLPWLMATGEDFRWPTTEGARPGVSARLVHRYLDRVMRVATRDRRVFQVYLHVLHLLRRPAALLGPSVLLPVAADLVAQALRRLGGSVARGAALSARRPSP